MESYDPSNCILLLLLLAARRIGIVTAFSTSFQTLESQGPLEDFDVTQMSGEKLLIKRLLEAYETTGIVGRPVYNTSETISVQFGIGLIQILDLNEKDQILTTNVWCRYIWKDILMQWDPEMFGGVKEVRVPADKIWTPDIVLYNYADTRLKEHREAMCVVNYEGSVLWIPPAMFSSTCSIDITNFPFDVQTCIMKFGSWTYDGFKLDLEFYVGKEEVDVNDYVKSNEWELVDHPASRNIKYYSCCKEPYPDLTFTVKLRRIAVFYNYILVLPCVLLSFLTLVIFWLPPESPAKILLGMNIFVAFFVLLLLLADITPPAASTIPLIGAYFCVNMILITLSTFLAVIVINTHIRGDRKNKVPDWLRKVFIIGLARALCMTEYLETPEPPPATVTTPTTATAIGITTPSSRTNPVSRTSFRQTSAAPDEDDSIPINQRTSLAGHLLTSHRQQSHCHHGNSNNNNHRTPLSVADSLVGGGHGSAAGSGATYRKNYGSSSTSAESTAAAAAYASSVASRVIQPPYPVVDTTQRIVDYNASVVSGSAGHFFVPPATTVSSMSSANIAAVFDHRHASLVASIERCTDQIPNGRALQSDIREIRRIIKSYVGRLQDREAAARNAKEWRIVARVLDRLFFIVYICTITVSLATMFPKGE